MSLSAGKHLTLIFKKLNTQMTRYLCYLLKGLSTTSLTTEKRKEMLKKNEGTVHLLLQYWVCFRSVARAVDHQGALQLHGPTMEQERAACGESVVRVCDKERKCDREKDMGKVVRKTEMLGK